MLVIDQSNQTALQNFLSRRHPEYESTIAHWVFCEETYSGGRDWFTGNIFRYIKEGDEEYDKRVERCYRFNHTREVVDLIQKYIFKSPVARNHDDAPDCVKVFWKDSTLSGLSIKQYARLISTLASICGRVWVFVDNTKTDDVTTLADEKASNARCYSYVVSPKDVLDMGFSDTGELNWILVRERVRDDSDPINSTGAVSERYRLWTKDSWYLFTITEKEDMAGQQPGIIRGPTTEPFQQLMLPGVMPYIAQAATTGERVFVKLEDQGSYNIGRVPCFPVDNVIGDNRYTAPALIADIAYLDRAVANYLSNLDAIIQDQTFSQLAMPAQNLLPGDDKYESVREMGTKRVFLYDGDGGAQPFFLSPDIKQAEIIVQVVNKIINEIYHSLGMGGERTKQDNAVGIDNSSGVAKAYDFERLNSLLTSKSEALQNCENMLVELVCLWNGAKPPQDDANQDKRLVKYADTFDVRSLYDEFTVAERLALVQAPDSVRQEQMKQVIDKLFPALGEKIKDKMLTDLKDWPPDPMDMLIQGTMTGSPSSAFPAKGVVKSQPGQPGQKAPAKKNPSTANRQGQVTSGTGK